MGRLVAIVQIDGVTGLFVVHRCGRARAAVSVIGQGVLNFLPDGIEVNFTMITIQSVLLDGEACKGLVCTNERLRSSSRQTPTLEFIPILVQRSYSRVNFISCLAETVLITVGSLRIFRRCGISAAVKVQDNRVSVRLDLRHILEGVGHVAGHRRSGVDGYFFGLIILVPAIGGIALIASATGGDRITQSCIAGLPNAVIGLFIERSKAHDLRTGSLTGRSIIPITVLNLVGHLGLQCIGDTVAIFIQAPNRIDGDVAVDKRGLHRTVG